MNEIERLENAQYLYWALQHTTSRVKEIITYRVIYGMTFREIGAIKQIPDTMARQLYLTGIKRLRERLRYIELVQDDIQKVKSGKKVYVYESKLRWYENEGYHIMPTNIEGVHLVYKGD